MDFSGIFMVTGATAIDSPDHIYIDSLATYDPTERVSKEENIAFHEAHKKKAVTDMVNFNHEHHLKDLMHETSSFFNKEMFGEDTLRDMVPEQLKISKELLKEASSRMYENIHYYYKLTAPLRTHKDLNSQMEQLRFMNLNMTNLKSEMELAKSQVDEYESRLH